MKQSLPWFLMTGLLLGGCPRPTQTKEQPAGTAVAGTPCTTDDGCASGLSCQERSEADPRRRCTAPCTSSTADAETTACGAGATCLSVGPSKAGACTRACEHGNPDAGCAADEVCTGWWFLQAGGQPDAPGCEPFCHSDAECPAGTRCDRTGACTSAVVRMAADGTACDPGAANTCAGNCLKMGAAASQGLCGSLVDLARGTACPDGNARVHPNAAPGDGVGLCVYQECSCATPACPPGLVCVEGAVQLQRVCAYVNSDAGVVAAQCAAADAGM